MRSGLQAAFFLLNSYLRFLASFVASSSNTITISALAFSNNINFNLNDKGWINFPDYQSRIIKNNKNIKWINKVHEQLIGSTRTGKFSPEEKFCIVHVKSIEKMLK